MNTHGILALQGRQVQPRLLRWAGDTDLHNHTGHSVWFRRGHVSQGLPRKTLSSASDRVSQRPSSLSPRWERECCSWNPLESRGVLAWGWNHGSQSREMGQWEKHQVPMTALCFCVKPVLQTAWQLSVQVREPIMPLTVCLLTVGFCYFQWLHLP